MEGIIINEFGTDVQNSSFLKIRLKDITFFLVLCLTSVCMLNIVVGRSNYSRTVKAVSHYERENPKK